MDKNDLIKTITNILTSHGFKRKGNNWVNNGEAINKIVNLQKSNYSNLYYINYNFIIRKLKLDGLKGHIGGRIGSLIPAEQKKIREILDLENASFTDSERVEELSKYTFILAKEMGQVNNPDDLLSFIKEKKILLIPGIVKEYFNLPIF